jgi:hypothetical protein
MRQSHSGGMTLENCHNTLASRPIIIYDQKYTQYKVNKAGQDIGPEVKTISSTSL